MSRIVRRGLEVALAIWIVAVVGLAVVAQLAPLAGMSVYAVRTGSMVPALRPADLVAVERIPAEAVQPGDVITVALAGGSIVTHRVVEAVGSPGGPTFITRGDANATADPVPVHPDQVRGRAVWRLPLAGIPLAMLSTPVGIVTLLSIAAILMLAIWLMDELRLDAEERALESELLDLRRRLQPIGAAS